MRLESRGALGVGSIGQPQLWATGRPSWPTTLPQAMHPVLPRAIRSPLTHVTRPRLARSHRPIYFAGAIPRSEQTQSCRMTGPCTWFAAKGYGCTPLTVSAFWTFITTSLTLVTHIRLWSRQSRSRESASPGRRDIWTNELLSTLSV